MSLKEILIISAPIRSGKTTSLLKFIGEHPDAYGILTPIIDGQRVFMDVQTKDGFRMEAAGGEPDPIQIGRYSFSAHAFNRAVEILRSSLKEPSGWLIVDEIGPLELKGLGFHDVLKEILQDAADLKLILVVRDTALDEVISYFELRNNGSVKVIRNLQE